MFIIVCIYICIVFVSLINWLAASGVRAAVAARRAVSPGGGGDEYVR